MQGNGDNPTFGPDMMPRISGAFFKWGLLIILVVLLLVGINVLRGIFTDWLWFDNVSFLHIFTKVLWTRVWLFLAGTAVVAVMSAITVFLVRRHPWGESVLPLPQDMIHQLDQLVVLASALGAVLVSVFFGASAAGRWDLVLRGMNAASFGTQDPVFQRDISFYVFSLPVLEMIQGWFLMVFIVLLIGTALLYLAHYSLKGVQFVATPWIRSHLAVLGSLIFFDLAAKHFLDRYELLFSPRGAVFGATYADVHAQLPAQMFLAAVAVACGILLLVSLLPALRGARGTRLILGTVALWLGAVILVGNLYPSFVQRFTVQPSELELEKPYIARSIQFTRAAFGLDRVEERLHTVSGGVTSELVAANKPTLSNVRLWDPPPLLDVYNQIQHLRLYYSFLDVDVDRYMIDDQYRQVLIGARELFPQNLPTEAQRWVNQRLQYTHGYGAAASPVTEFTAEGRPIFFVKDVPPDPNALLKITRPEIYFGENTQGYIIVNSRQPEFDRPTEQDTPVYVKYAGQGGVQLSSYIRRLAYAWQFSDVNILISNQVTPESRIQYVRNIQDRVRKVAPFLMLDSDPYMVVENGRMLWIQDGYTTTSRYPYSRPFNGTFNYIRNSVKVVIDPYTGFMDFYISDPNDPMIQTYAGIFPTMFKPLDQMSPFLRQHLRYPEDMFTVQAETYLQYHMTDPTVFFNKEDQWSVPVTAFFGKQQTMEPYYVIMTLPGETEPEFVLILPFTPASKPNMVAWLAARMDGPRYGQLLNFTFPRGVQLDGPAQIEARIDNDTVISQQFTLWSQVGSKVIRGNLLVIPLGDSILYVEPIYLQAQDLALPELKRVILASANKVVMEETLDKSLSALLGTATTVGPQPPTQEQPPSTSDMAQKLKAVQEALQKLKDGLASLEQTVSDLAKILAEEQK